MKDYMQILARKMRNPERCKCQWKTTCSQCWKGYDSAWKFTDFHHLCRLDRSTSILHQAYQSDLHTSSGTTPITPFITSNLPFLCIFVIITVSYLYIPDIYSHPHIFLLSAFLFPEFLYLLLSCELNLSWLPAPFSPPLAIGSVQWPPLLYLLWALSDPLLL